MVTGFALIPVFLLSMAVLLFIVIKLKINPFLGLLIISYLTGFVILLIISLFI